MPSEPRGDVDAVAHQIAVALLDDVAEMNADAKLDAALGRHAGVALDHAVLDFDGAAHRVDHAAELDDGAVAGALDDAAVMHGDGRIDQIAAQGASTSATPRWVTRHSEVDHGVRSPWSIGSRSRWPRSRSGSR